MQRFVRRRVWQCVIASAVSVSMFSSIDPCIANQDIADPEMGRIVQKGFGIIPDFRPGGAVVKNIDPAGPASNLRRVGDPARTPFTLLVGDVITHVNGIPINDVNAFIQAMDTSPREATLTIIDGPTGAIDDWICKMQLVQQRLLITPGFRRQGGVRVESISPASPTRSMRLLGGPQGQPWTLQPGDLITHVNGEAVVGVTSFTRSLNRSFGEAVLTVEDGQTGVINIFITRTTPVEIRPPAPTGVQDEPPTLANLGSGRSNIRKKTFHVLLIFDSCSMES